MIFYIDRATGGVRGYKNLFKPSFGPKHVLKTVDRQLQARVT